MNSDPVVLGAARAAVIAGPLYGFSLLIFLAMDQLPHTIPVGWDAVVIVPLTFVVLLVGAIPGFLGSLLGSAILGGLANRFELLRAGVVWLAAGAAIGTTLWLWNAMPVEVGAPLAITSAGCALRCHRAWTSEWQQPRHFAWN